MRTVRTGRVAAADADWVSAAAASVHRGIRDAGVAPARAAVVGRGPCLRAFRVRSPAIRPTRVRLSAIRPTRVRLLSIQHRFSPLNVHEANPEPSDGGNPNPEAHLLSIRRRFFVPERPRGEPGAFRWRKFEPGSSPAGRSRSARQARTACIAINDSDGTSPGARGLAPWTCLSSGCAYPTPIPPGGVKWDVEFEREGWHAQVSRGRSSSTSGTAACDVTVSCVRLSAVYGCQLCTTVSCVKSHPCFSMYH